jgi:PAS domain S-box-containing protein
VSQQGQIAHHDIPHALETLNDSSRPHRAESGPPPGSDSLSEKARGQAFILETIFDAVVVADDEGRVIDWYPAAERMFGYAKEEMLGRYMSELLQSGTERREWQGFVSLLMEKGRFTTELPFIRKDGTGLVAEVNLVPLRDDSGSFAGVVGVNRDVTARKNMERELAQQTRELEALNKIADALAGTIEPARVMQLICSFAYDLTGAERTRISVPNHDASEFITAALSSPARQVYDITVPAHSIIGWVYQNRQMVNLAHLKEHGWLYEVEGHPEDQEIAGIFLPLLHDEKIFGVLGVMRFSGERFSDAEVSLLQTFATHAAVALENANKYQGLARRMNVLTELSDLSLRLASTFDLNEIMQAACTSARQVLQASRSSVRLLENDELTEGIGVGYHDQEGRRHRIRVDDMLSSGLQDLVPLVIQDIRLDPRVPPPRLERMLAEQSIAFLAVPLQIEGRAVGLLSITKEQPHHWSPDEIDFAKAVGNITALAIAQAQKHASVAEEHEQFTALIQSLQSGLFKTDETGRITFWNQAAQDISGWRIARAAEKTWSELFVLTDGDAFELFTDIISRDAPRFEWNRFRLATLSRGMIPVACGFAPLHDSNGKVVGVVGTFQDLSELREVENQYLQLMSNLSHDLMTPITAVLPLLELLPDPTFDEADRIETRELVLSQALRLKGVFQNYIEMARSTSGVLVELERIDVVDLTRKMIDEYVKADRRHHFELESGAPILNVLADRGRLQQALFNLYDNAVKYSAPKTGIYTSIHKDGETIGIEIRDEGSGIPPEELERIFDRWHRGRALGEQFAYGHGIGLSLVKSFVESMGGKTWAVSDGRHGSTFYVQLAAAPEE